MPKSDNFLAVEAAAHSGAFGNNPIPSPTEAQCVAGNYKMGRVSLHGLSIAIEQPRGTYRTGVDAKTGKRWTNRMAAHYGYFERTKGADGDGVDCFVGFYPQSESAYVINQFVLGKFDEVKVMVAFPDEETARRAYVDSYDRGWNGLKSIVPVSISQLKWWLKHGDMRRPINAENLPYEGLETMNKNIQWTSDALPKGQTIDHVLYDIRRADSGDNLLLDSVCLNDIIEDSDGAMTFDALIAPYAILGRKMELVKMAMTRASNSVTPVAVQITDPFKQRGVANVAVIFELSDGQTVSIFFHNPDVTPNKMAGTDELISWKWLLNKKDITIVVAPERGEDLNIREVARRIMKLAEKNSAAFMRANVKRAETMQRIDGIKTEIAGLEVELKKAMNDLEAAKLEAEDRAIKRSNLIASDFNGLWRVTSAKNMNPISPSYPTKAEAEAAIDFYIRTGDFPASSDSLKADEFDPTSPDGYAQVMADEALQLKWQDRLDAFFQGRIVDVRNSLRELGWNNKSDGDNTLTKDGAWIASAYKQVGAGKNIVGASYHVVTADGRSDKIDDGLTNTSAEFAADIDAEYAALGAAKPGSQSTEISVTGNELGDFPDTDDGKKALRNAAKDILEAMVGTWVPCPALGGDVEIRKSGAKKFISTSADARKLRLVSALSRIIGGGRKLASRPPYDGDSDKSARAYHTLRSEVSLAGEAIAVRTVVKEDTNGKFHYDMTVHAIEAVFDNTKDEGHDESQPPGMTTTNGGGTYPSRFARHQLDSIVGNGEQEINTAIDSLGYSKTDDLDGIELDAATGDRMVINLFIEGEEPESVKDEQIDQETDDQRADRIKGTKGSDRTPEDVDWYNKRSRAAAKQKIDDQEKRRQLFLSTYPLSQWNRVTGSLDKEIDLGDGRVSIWDQVDRLVESGYTVVLDKNGKRVLVDGEMQGYGVGQIGEFGIAYAAFVTGESKSDKDAMIAQVDIPTVDVPDEQKTEVSAPSLESLIAAVKTHYVADMPIDAPEGWIIMNAPRPLLGTKTIEGGDFLTGRFYAAIDPNDSVAQRFVEENIKLDAVVVLQASVEAQTEIALEGAGQYRAAYEAMAPEKRAEAVKPLIQRIQGKPYAEAKAFLDAAKAKSAPVIAPIEPSAVTEDPQMTADKALYQSVIDGTAPDMLAPELADLLEAAYYRHAGNPESDSMFEQAVNAYQAAMLAATANIA